MKFVILTNVPKSEGRRAVKREAEARGHTLDLISLYDTEVSASNLADIAEQLQSYDVVHHAGGLGVSIAAYVHEQLANRRTFCVNSFTRVPQSAGNKVYQAACFARDGIPIPQTWRSHRPRFETLAETLGLPFIAKDPRSTQGARVWLIQEEQDLSHLTHDKEYLFQAFVPNDGDFRVHVVGGRAFCPYKRISPAGDFRSNISLGGRIARVESEDEKRTLYTLAMQAARAMQLDYCGVDIVRSSEDGTYYVLETNSDPGFKDVEQATGEPYAQAIVDYYESVAHT